MQLTLYMLKKCSFIAKFVIFQILKFSKVSKTRTTYIKQVRWAIPAYSL